MMFSLSSSSGSKHWLLRLTKSIALPIQSIVDVYRIADHQEYSMSYSQMATKRRVDKKHSANWTQQENRHAHTSM